MNIKFRLAAFFAAQFILFGLNLPFWPLWLASRGLNPEQIGIVLACSMLMKASIGPFITSLADRVASRRRLLLGVVASNCLFWTGYVFDGGFYWIVLIAAMSGASMSAIVSLSDNLALLHARQEGFAYGTVRMWASLSFLATAQAIGYVLLIIPAGDLLWIALPSALVALLVALIVPDPRTPDPRMPDPRVSDQRAATAQAQPPRRFDPLPVLRDRQMLLMWLIGGLLQNSHLFYYGFSALHWKAHGVPESTIGALWAGGVVVEIVLFALAGKIGWLSRPRILFALAAVGGTVRWTLFAFTTDPALLVLGQAMHALTFAAAHLGAMIYLAERSPPGLSATAQGLFAAIPLGFGSFAVYLMAGSLYRAVEGYGFLLMAAFAAIAGLCVLKLKPAVPLSHTA